MGRRTLELRHLIKDSRFDVFSFDYEFYVDDDNVPKSRIIYQKTFGKPMMCKPSKHLIEYIENQNLEVQSIIGSLPDELPFHNTKENEGSTKGVSTEPQLVPFSTVFVERGTS